MTVLCAQKTRLGVEGPTRQAEDNILRLVGECFPICLLVWHLAEVVVFRSTLLWDHKAQCSAKTFVFRTSVAVSVVRTSAITLGDCKSQPACASSDFFQTPKEMGESLCCTSE